MAGGHARPDGTVPGAVRVAVPAAVRTVVSTPVPTTAGQAAA